MGENPYWLLNILTELFFNKDEWNTRRRWCYSTIEETKLVAPMVEFLSGIQKMKKLNMQKDNGA